VHGTGDDAVEMADARLGPQHFGFHALGGMQEDFAFGRQFAAVGAPHQQPRLQPLLERRHPPRQRRMVDAEPLRGGKDLAGPGNGKKHADIVPVHDWPYVYLCTTVDYISALICAN
jgi:hypothetical protein